LITNNTGLEKRGALGHHEIDIVTYERGRPEPLDRTGHAKYIAGEMCQTMNSHWGIGTGDFSYISPKQIIEDLCACRKIGANFLLNVGLEAAGNIPEYEAAAFKRIGAWFKEYGDIIYNGKPSRIISTNGDFVLEHKDKVYLFINDLSIRGHSDVTLKSCQNMARTFSGFKKKVVGVKFLNKPALYEFDAREGKLTLVPPGWPYGTNQVVKILEVSMEA
jgi:alpha-L-fucosidase